MSAALHRANGEATSLDAVLRAAREAGRAGQSWHDWSMSDEAQDAFVALNLRSRDQRAIEAAFAEGAREYRIAGGWRSVWTTAPADYDQFGTETIEDGGEWRGKQIRRVLVDPSYFSYQTARYESGLHGWWDEDPRVEEARWREKHERQLAEDAAREAKRAAGVEWLKTATEGELENFDTFEARGLRYDDVRAEKKRRQEEAERSARDVAWSRASAIVPEGATLVDRGTPNARGTYGTIRGKDSHVYYDVRIVRGWPDDAEHASVVGDGRDEAGSLSYVADWIASGRMRIAEPGSVPPKPVVDRIGHDRVDEIQRVEAAGKTVWVGRPLFATDDLILDERGRLVRAKKVIEAVAAARGANRAAPAPASYVLRFLSSFHAEKFVDDANSTTRARTIARIKPGTTATVLFYPPEGFRPEEVEQAARRYGGVVSERPVAWRGSLASGLTPVPYDPSRNRAARSSKPWRFPEGVMTMEDWVDRYGGEAEEYAVAPSDLFDRARFNRMASRDEQDAYEESLRRQAQKPRYRVWNRGHDVFYDVSKATYERARRRGVGNRADGGGLSKYEITRQAQVAADKHAHHLLNPESGPPTRSEIEWMIVESARWEPARDFRSNLEVPLSDRQRRWYDDAYRAQMKKELTRAYLEAPSE